MSTWPRGIDQSYFENLFVLQHSTLEASHHLSLPKSLTATSRHMQNKVHTVQIARATAFVQENQV